MRGGTSPSALTPVRRPPALASSLPLLLPFGQVLMSLDGTQQQAEASDRMSQALSLSSPVMAALRHPNCCALLGVCAFPPALVTGGAWQGRAPADA